MRGRPYPFPDDAGELAARLRERFGFWKGLTPWHEPTFFERKYVRHTAAPLLAAAWREATGNSEPVRLAIRECSPLTLPWYIQHLAPRLISATSVFSAAQPLSPLMDWSWPLRIGIAPGPDAPEYGRVLESLLREPWFDGIVDAADPCAPGTVCDFMVVPAGASAESALLALPAPVLAHCLIVTQVTDESLDVVNTGIERLMALTQAKGLLVLGGGAEKMHLWLALLVRNLSHNHTLDEAVWDAYYDLAPPRVRVPILHATPLLVDASKVERHIGRLERILDELPLQPSEEVEEEEEEEEDIGQTGAEPPPSAPATTEWLRRDWRTLAYGAETQGATTLSRFTRRLRAAAPEPSRREPPSGRELQCGVFLAEDEAARMHVDGPLTKAFVAGLKHFAHVRIAVPEQCWLGLGEPFPEQELPPNERGHLLTVVFSDPASEGGPQVSTMLLPRTGTSSVSKFSFIPRAQDEALDARILVLYENRVIQTARLTGPILSEEQFLALARGWMPSGAEAVAPAFVAAIRLLPECIVRPLEAGLDDRRRFRATLLMNHTAGNVPQVTTVLGLHATRIEVAGLKTAIEAIGNLWDRMPWEQAAFPAADSAETRRLLRSLAVHGRLLYDELVFNQGLVETLQGSEPIQAISAHEGSFLPLEFCYTREPAAIEGDAPLCAKWRTALEDGGCQGPCGVPDDGSVVCPLAFWGLRRVIEWHQFQRADSQQLRERGEEFAVQSEPTPRRGTLEPLNRILLGASRKVTGASALATNISNLLHSAPLQAADWWTWREFVQQNPSLLVLMVHTEERNQLRTMEMGGAPLDPPRIAQALVCSQPPPETGPVVLLLGCGTGVSDAEFRAFTAQFRRAGAAIVVSTIAQLHADHAPRLAQAIIEELQYGVRSERTFGEVMLSVRRKCLLQCTPIAMVLLGYGDADWRV